MDHPCIWPLLNAYRHHVLKHENSKYSQDDKWVISKKISKLRGINHSFFPIKLAQQDYLMMRSKRFGECLFRQEQKNTQLQKQMKRLFYSLGSLISVLAGTEKQLSDTEGCLQLW